MQLSPQYIVVLRKLNPSPFKLWPKWALAFEFIQFVSQVAHALSQWHWNRAPLDIKIWVETFADVPNVKRSLWLGFNEKIREGARTSCMFRVRSIRKPLWGSFIFPLASYVADILSQLIYLKDPRLHALTADNVAWPPSWSFLGLITQRSCLHLPLPGSPRSDILDIPIAYVRKTLGCDGDHLANPSAGLLAYGLITTLQLVLVLLWYFEPNGMPAEEPIIFLDWSSVNYASQLAEKFKMLRTTRRSNRLNCGELPVGACTEVLDVTFGILRRV